MEKYKPLEIHIKEMPANEIVTVKNKLIYPIALLVLGLILLIVGIIGITNQSFVNIILDVVGITLLIAGCIVWWVKSKVTYCYKPTGEKLKKYELFIKHNSLDKLIHFLVEQNFNSLKDVVKEETSNKLIHLMVSDKGTFALAQVCEYIPFTYEPTTPVYVLKDEKAKLLYDFCHNK